MQLLQLHPGPSPLVLQFHVADLQTAPECKNAIQCFTMIINIVKNCQNCHCQNNNHRQCNVAKDLAEVKAAAVSVVLRQC